MSVQTEIDRIIGAVEAAHTAIAEKGGTTARPYLVGNLADAINTIPESADPKLQAKTISPSTSSQTVKPDSGYDALSQVTVNAMPTATLEKPTIKVGTNGVVTASVTQSTAGYIAKDASNSNTYTMTTQAAKTITPSTSSQTAVASGRYTTGAVTVAAIPSTYVKPTATKSATTYTPSTANQTIAAGTYCSGTQTIKGDSNLVAGNIKSGVSIFGVTGSYEGSGGGSSGGGASVETCTVMLKGGMSTYRPYYVSYMTADNSGNLSAQAVTNSAMSLTLYNVVCGSVVTVYWYNTSAVVPTKARLLISGGKYFNAYEITAGNGEIAYLENGSGGSAA